MRHVGVSRVYFWISTVLPAVLLVGTAVGLALGWDRIPAEIPTHFSSAGQPDTWGGKSALWTQTGTGAVLYLALLVLSFFPKLWRLRGIGRSVDPAVALRAMGGLLADFRLTITLLFMFLTAWSALCAPGPGWIQAAASYVLIFAPVIRLLLRLYVLKR